MEDDKQDEKLVAVNVKENISPPPPYLPHDIIDEILRRLPSKHAVRLSFLSKQLEGRRMWCCYSSDHPLVLDFDVVNDGEYRSVEEDLTDFEVAEEISEGFFDFLEKHNVSTIHKFRLCIERFLPMYSYIADEWLSFVLERGVKELDMIFRISTKFLYYKYTDWDYFIFNPMDFINAKSLTSLTLECVRIIFFRTRYPFTLKRRISSNQEKPRSILPSLKILSLKQVPLNDDAQDFLKFECRLVQHLRLISCFDDPVSTSFRLENNNLKSLQLKNCNFTRYFQVDMGENLESFELDSLQVPDDPLYSIFLFNTPKLKYINVKGNQLRQLWLGSHGNIVNATINTPHLDFFYLHSVLESKASLNIPSDDLCECAAEIVVCDLWCGNKLPTFNALMAFLQQFDCFGNITLIIHDFEAFIFPENMKKSLSPPFPRLKNLTLRTWNPAMEENQIYDLWYSLAWMAPSAHIFLD